MRRAAVLVLLLLTTAATAQDVVISSISPAFGSIAGGTRVAIFGSGFSRDRFTGGNTVYFGKGVCTVLNHKTSDTLITCVTSAAVAAGPVAVTVVVDGAATATSCCYTYSADYTPVLQTLWPQAGPAGSTASLFGYSTWLLDQDCSSSLEFAEGSPPSCIGSVMLNGWLCSTAGPDAWARASYARFNWAWMFRLNCSMPSPSMGDPQVGVGVAGNTNVSLSFEGRTAGGLAASRRASFLAAPGKAPRQFQVYPVVQSVRPATGSAAGGTLVTIAGRGFPSSSMPGNNAITQLLVGGVPCQVVASNFSSITCRTQPQPSAPQPAVMACSANGTVAAASNDTSNSTAASNTTSSNGGQSCSSGSFGGLFPGMRGVMYEQFNRTVGYSQLGEVLQNWTLNFTAGDASAVLGAAWESPTIEAVSFCTRSRAFFTAVNPGNHSFWVVADDFARLRATFADGSSAWLVNITGYTGGMNEWAASPSQRSRPVLLAAGEALLLEAVHCQSPSGPSRLQVGVTVPNTQPEWSSTPEVQRVTVRHSLFGQQRLLTLLAPAGNDSVINITLAATDPAVLRHPNLGLNVTVNGSSLPALVAVADGQQGADAMARLLRQVLKLSSSLALGVEWSAAADGRSVTYQVAAAGSTNIGLLSSVGVSATVAAIAPAPAVPGTCPNATCAFSTPVWVLSNLSSPDNNTSGSVYYATYPQVPIFSSVCSQPLPAAAADASAPTLDGITVAVVPVTVPGVDLRAVQLSIWGSDPFNVIQLPWNASAAAVAAAVDLATGFRPTVTQRSVRVGARTGLQWVLDYSWRLSNNTLPFNTALQPADTTAGAPQLPDGASLTLQLFRNASQPFGGSFTLSLGSFCDAVTVQVGESEDSFRAKINSLPGVGGAHAADGVEVQRAVDENARLIYTVTFSSLAGDLPELRVVDSSNVTGSQPSVTVTTLQNGSTDAFYGPIPGEMLRVPVTYNNTVQLEVNGVAAACGSTYETTLSLPPGSAADAAVCGFSHSIAATPIVTRVVPTVPINASNLVPVVIDGTLFSTVAKDNTVFLGPSPCSNVAVRATSGQYATQLGCSITAETTTGVRQVLVTVAGRGLAAGNFTVSLKTLLLVSRSPASSTLSGAGITVFNINGRGFDTARCSRNWVWVGGVQCAVLSCTTKQLTVWYPGGVEDAAAAVRVSVQSDDGSFDPATSTADALWTVPVAAAGSSGWRVAALQSDPVLPVGGAEVVFSVEGFDTSSISRWKVQLLPAADLSSSNMTDPAFSASISSSIASGITCSSLVAQDASTAVCKLRVVPPGTYWLAVSYMGATLILQPNMSAPDSSKERGLLKSRFGVRSVTPQIGSIGGGSLLSIAGQGFDALDLSTAVVVILVPVSTTFLNGVILCDVANISSSGDVLTCRTRAHLATAASSDDAMGFKLEARDTEPGSVQLLLCSDMPSNDALKLYCWDDPTPRTTCYGTQPGACSFSYSWAVTPLVTSTSPVAGVAGDTLLVTGRALEDVTAVWLQASWGRLACSAVQVTGSNVTCTIPEAPAGSYQVVLQKANGELGVDAVPSQPARFVYSPVITAVRSGGGAVAAGSMQGGALLQLASSAAAFNTTAIDQNRVLVGGLPCEVDAGSVTATQLACRAPSLAGQLLAEFWQMPAGTRVIPQDFGSYSRPDTRMFMPQLDVSWGASAPAGISSDSFAGRFRFVLRVPVGGNHSFTLNVDDQARLIIDDEVLLDSVVGYTGTASMLLQQGWHDVEVHFMEFGGGASIRLAVSVDGGPSTTIPQSQSYLARPGNMVPVQAWINGAAARSNCSSSSSAVPSTATPPSPAPDTSEATSLAAAGPACGCFSSSYLTPSVTSFAVSAAPDSGAPSVLTLTGALLTNQAGDVTVTVGGEQCSITEAAANGSSISCTLPALPAGDADVMLAVAGAGYAAMPGGSNTVRITTPLVTRSLTPARGSYHGGVVLSVAGSGFAKLPSNSSVQMEVTIFGSAPGPIAPALASATNVLAAIRLPYYKALVSAATRQLTLQLRVFDRASNATVATATLPYILDTAYTPSVTRVTPATLEPFTAANLTLSWSVGAAAAGAVGVNDRLPAGTASVARVFLQGGATGRAYECGLVAGEGATPQVVITTSNLNSTGGSYQEAIACQLPATLPAAAYDVWVCLEGVGCGFAAAAVRVPVNVSSISRSAGSIAGGTELDIAGTGFSPEVGAVAVSFGNSSCAVTAVNATAITCVTGALAANMTAGRAYAAVITPSQGATAQAFNSTTFTYDAALTPILASVTPARGSTEGGTAITITGSFPDSFAGNMSVTLGSTTCSSALLVNISTITCTSGNPTAGNATAPRPRGPQAVRVLFEGLGYAATLQQLQSANTSATAGNVTAASSSAAGAVTYEYVDLWSRRTTWGGGDPPVEGDMVLVPAGTTVLLDVSPPLLSALVLEGDLLFDDNAGEEIHLQAGYILVKGGSLQVGSEERPFPGAACITLHGGPDSPEIPLYGGKVLAVRDGSVRLHGLPKQPTWTVLNATANVGDTSITVNGPINWQVGDRIVIASSSFYATDVDEATITNITALGASSEGSAAVQLELDVPLVYTHLGEVVTVPGDSHVLDMRAEVAVLNRNVRLMGDPSSPETLYGAQVMVSTPARRPRAILRFTHVEVQWGGQAFRLGRYPIHWHMHGDAAMQSWVKGCSIHHSFQRAVTIHGTHRVLLENNVAYDIMGHTYFFEDALEWGSVLRGNLGILTRVSNAMLNTDTTPATYWITNPNNTIENNVAAGSAGYGFWYRLLDFPEGPSFTTSYCPKFVALRRFANNAAHSNMFYGLRIHPEYYPKTNPCDNTFQQLPAVFDGFISYKNGVKGAMCTQVGLVQLRNFAVADNGAGPRVHVINGKEHGGGIEIAWVVDDRSQANVVLENMAGVQDSLIISRTEAGRQGTAGAWPSNRGVRGLITQSPPHAHPRHSALMSVINVTFVNFTTSNSQFRALEACGKCKNFQGGATTFTRNLTFIQQGKPALADWSWGHQGIYLDTDGSLINQNTLDSGDLPTGWNLGPGVTYHSAVESQLFNQPECVYIGNGNAAYCKPDLAFRRVMLNGHGPIALKFRDLLVTSDATNRTSRVHHTNYNEDGYQFTCATRRSYWLHWDTPYQLSPETFSLHKPDLMNATHGWLYLTAKWPQVYDRVTVNGKSASPPAAALPATPFNASHGSLFYNKTLSPVGWWWGNETFNMTTAAVLLAGRSDSALRVTPVECPVQGCNVLGKPAADFRNGTLLWSDNATWANTTPGKPRAGSNVTIPFGWNLVIDESPPPLYMLVIEGNVWFSNTTNITLAASFIIVQRTGVLLAGSPDAPHPTPATILLAGTRQTPQLAISNDLVLGSKVLAVVAGGRLSLHGSSIPTRITRLAAPAAAGSSSITVDGSSSSLAGWSVGKQILVTSTTFNPDQVEFRRIAAVQPAADSSQLVLVLDSLLAWSHGGGVYSYANSAYALDTRAEVALLDSNVVIAPADGSLQYDAGGNKFGPRVLAAGNSSCQLANIQMSLCGQAGLTRACVQFQGLTGQAHDNSYLRSSVILRAHDAALRTLPGTTSVEAASGVLVRGNVFFESYDTSTVVVGGHHALLEANLALGTTKDMSGKSSFDTQLPATYELWNSAVNNSLRGNIAAGSHRLGYHIPGEPCSRSQPLMTNNVAHSNLAGVILRAEPGGSSCSRLSNFTSWASWDFGLITMKGITSDLQLQHVVIADMRHVGILVLRKAAMTEPAAVTFTGGLLVGRSSAEVCAACRAPSDAGCHPRLSSRSYDRAAPFGASVGLASSVFALDFTVGPEMKPWDHTHAYHSILGNMRVSGVTLANFEGTAACGSSPASGTFALSNHPHAPDAFHPHVFSNMTKVNVPDAGLFLMHGPDPEWRNEADCGEATYTRPDGSSIPLNCAGPKHAYFRDSDGSLTGVPGSTVLGAYAAPRSDSLIDQGSAVVPGPCSWVAAFQGYHCRPGVTTTQLGSGWLPSPMPAAGIWGDPQMLVVESRDSDSEDRNFSPVMLSGGGVTDLAITAMDQGWCMQAYTCQKRLSTFWMTAATGQLMKLNFTGTPSKVLRLWLPYADPAAELVLAINMLQLPNRRFSWTESRRRINPLDSPPAIGDASVHGDYYWDQNSTTFTVKLRGSGSSIEVRSENAIAVTQKLALSFNDFFDSTQARFMASLAFVLGIDVSRLKVVRVVPGSVVLDYLILEDPAIATAPLPEKTFDTSKNVDRETAALLATMDPAAQAAYMANTSAAIQASNAAVGGATPVQDPAGSGSGSGDAGAGAGSSASSSPSAAAAAELLQIFEVLKASIADGSMENKTGVTTLDLSAAVVLATPPVAGFEDNSSLTVTLQEIRQQQGQTEPPTTQQPQPASKPDAQPKDRLSSLLPVLLPVVLGVAVLAAAGLFGMKVVRMRRLGRVAVAGGQPAAAGPANGGGTGNLLMDVLNGRIYKLTSYKRLAAAAPAATDAQSSLAAAPSPPPPSGGSASNMQVLASGASSTAAGGAANLGKRAGSMTAQQQLLPAILPEAVGKRRSLPPLPHQAGLKRAPELRPDHQDGATSS